VRVRGSWGELDVDGDAPRAVSLHRLWTAFENTSRDARWTSSQRDVVGEMLWSRDPHDIAEARGSTVRAVRKHAGDAAAKAGARGALDLIGRLLRRAALAEIRPNALMIAMLFPHGPHGFAQRDHADLLVAMTAGRIELAIVTLCAVDLLTASEERVLRQGVAGFERGEIAELLALERCTVDNYSAMICQKHAFATRLVHAILDVFRLACAVRLPRYTLPNGQLRGGGVDWRVPMRLALPVCSPSR